MKRSPLCAALWLAIIMAISGCATTGTITAPPSTDESRAVSVVKELSAAYESRDAGRFMTLVSAKYLGGYEDLQQRLTDVLDNTVSIDLNIVPERIWNEPADTGKVFMDARFTKTITGSGYGAPVFSSGDVTFIFIKYDTGVLKLFSQKGNPVFP